MLNIDPKLKQRLLHSVVIAFAAIIGIYFASWVGYTFGGVDSGWVGLPTFFISIGIGFGSLFGGVFLISQIWSDF